MTSQRLRRHARSLHDPGPLRDLTAEELAILLRRVAAHRLNSQTQKSPADVGLYEILQILSLNLFEKTPLDSALTLSTGSGKPLLNGNQLILFDTRWDRPDAAYVR